MATYITDEEIMDEVESFRHETDPKEGGEWVAKWVSAGSWAFCHGHWELYRDGERVDTRIPFADGPADTFGSYLSWGFGGEDGWTEVWDEYENGLDEGDWCDRNRAWLEGLAPRTEWGKVYAAFQRSDFRPNSCGGCI